MKKIYMRDWEKEIKERCKFIYDIVKNNAKAKGVTIGLSGGKDSVLCSYLCKKAGLNVTGISMPCGNIQSDEDDAKRYADMFGITFKVINLLNPYNLIVEEIKSQSNIIPSELSLMNIKPRLRMTTLYTIAQTNGDLVCGTDNKSESIMGYFTKWGDGAADFMPISDLTVTEIFDCLQYIQDTEGYDLQNIINKAPSAGLFEGQTDEDEMGVTYKEIDEYLLNGITNNKALQIIKSTELKTMHKRILPHTFK